MFRIMVTVQVLTRYYTEGIRIQGCVIYYTLIDLGLRDILVSFMYAINHRKNVLEFKKYTIS